MGIANYVLLINEEQNKNKGEDSGICLLNGQNAGMIASLDGCGGAGSDHYPIASNWSGARIASRQVGLALAKWFDEKCYGERGFGSKTAETLADEIKEYACEELNWLNKNICYSSSGLESRLSKLFPTTLAGVLVEAKQTNLLRLILFWAGDSRAYLFTSGGLVQVSRDDIRGRHDPFEALVNDGKLSNVISANSDFKIHVSEELINQPCMVMTATDGCFSYFNSPIILEGVILKTLLQAKNPNEWERNLKQAIGEVASDDYTMQIAVLGFSNFSAVKTAYQKRWDYYLQQYAEPLQRVLHEKDDRAHYELWLEYKKSYMQDN